MREGLSLRKRRFEWRAAGALRERCGPQDTFQALGTGRDRRWLGAIICRLPGREMVNDRHQQHAVGGTTTDWHLMLGRKRTTKTSSGILGSNTPYTFPMNGVRAVLHYDAGIDIDTSMAFAVRLQYEYTPCTQNERTGHDSGL